MRKIIASLLLVSALLSVALCSCGKTESEIPETRVIKHWNDIWNGKTVMTETFDYSETFPPNSDGKVLKLKGKGYRLVQRDSETGSTECVCRDPICSHSTMAECPAVSANPILLFAVIGNRLFYYCEGINYAASAPGTPDTLHTLKYIDLTGAGSGTVFSCENREQTSYWLGDDFAFFTVPDVVEEKTVFLI